MGPLPHPQEAAPSFSLMGLWVHRFSRLSKKNNKKQGIKKRNKYIKQLPQQLIWPVIKEQNVFPLFFMWFPWDVKEREEETEWPPLENASASCFAPNHIMVTPALLQPSASTSALEAHSAFGPEAV